MGIFNPDNYDESQPFKRPPKDLIRFTVGESGQPEFHLDLAAVEIGREIQAMGLERELEQYLRPLFMRVLKSIHQHWREQGETEAALDYALQKANRDLAPAYRKALDRFAKKYLTFPIPVNPANLATLKAIYGGKRRAGWEDDAEGQPTFIYEGGDGHITIWVAGRPGGGETAAALWQAVENLGVWTADVFLILLGKIAALRNPADVAAITLDEMAAMRGVKCLDGSPGRLRDALKEEIFKLADLRLTMVWKDYKTGEIITIGKDSPGLLLQVLDWQCEQNAWVGFTFRCGQALALFIDPDGIRWIGYYSKMLLKLNPKDDRLAKKIGTYFLFIGRAGKTGALTPKVKTILEYIGEAPDPKHPGEFVKQFNKAIRRLYEISFLWGEQTNLDGLYSGKKGGLMAWLDAKVPVRLSHNIWLSQGARAALPGPTPSDRGQPLIPAESGR